MSARRIMLIVVALLITVGTAAVARNWVSSRQTVVQAPSPVAAPIKGPMVLVAQTDIPTGVFVQPNYLRWTIWPDDIIPENYFTNDLFAMEDLSGAVVRRGFTAGEPITKKRIVQPGERGFLAAVLRPGYRAMAIRVNATSGIGGLVFPGDRVDMILTHEVKVSGSDEKKHMVSETFLTNVRVLAIDQFVDEADGKPRVGKNATIEITPKQAEMLAVVSEIGPISLVLRSLAKDEEELDALANLEDPLAEPDPERGKTYTFDSEVSILASPSSGKSVDVSRGNTVTERRF